MVHSPASGTLPMEYRYLGASGFRVPVLSFGTGTFGGQGALFSAWGSTDVAEARRLDTEHQRLQVEKRAQATPLRVEKMARAQLNMRTATPAITQYVSDPAGADVAASGAKAKPAPAVEGAR